MPRALELAASQPWLMLPDALDNLLTIADRMGDPGALESKPVFGWRTAARSAFATASPSFRWSVRFFATPICLPR